MTFAPTFCITFIFHFLWIVQSFQVKLMTILLQNFEGATRYIVGDVQMANVKKMRRLHQYFHKLSTY